jgi:predicted DNA-binding WGR domain protein
LPYELALEYDHSYDRGGDMGRKTPERGGGGGNDDDDDDAKPAEEIDRASAETQPVSVREDGERWPDATPNPALARARTATVAVQSNVDLGRPPDMPTSSAPPPLVLGAVEDPTHMPGPRDIPSGDPEDAAPPPGHVPPGDSRSFRRGNEFALIYRVGTSIIIRSGRVGTRGQWRVVEYPTSATASSSYAKECSRFVSDGFSDYRDQ